MFKHTHLFFLIITVFAIFGSSSSEARIPEILRRVFIPEKTSPVDFRGNGFALYRTSKPGSGRHLRRLCEAGVTEIMVLDGSGDVDVELAKSICPRGLKVLNVSEQSADIPLSADFLRSFDEWVERAQSNGTKIAVRCTCGCHRTGRLIAYYQMKYANVKLTAGQAIKEMRAKGRYMFYRRSVLENQVRALENFASGEACSVPDAYCVREESEPSTIEEL